MNPLSLPGIFVCRARFGERTVITGIEEDGETGECGVKKYRRREIASARKIGTDRTGGIPWLPIS